MQLLHILPFLSGVATAVNVLGCAGFEYRDGVLYFSEDANAQMNFYYDVNNQVRVATYLGMTDGVTSKFHLEEGFMSIDTSPGAFAPVEFGGEGEGDNNHWDDYIGFIVYNPDEEENPKSLVGGFQYSVQDNRRLYWNQTLYELQIPNPLYAEGAVTIGQCSVYINYVFDNE
ncbi:hypothetical protein GGS20DRAFT_499650 [Poronia punctata]|nr:hypothetical protein GGS20DRAFT_499650 [Poronia punctata]